MNEEETEEPLLENLLTSLQALLKSYKSQNLQNNQILLENQKLLTSLQKWEARNKNEVFGVNDVMIAQASINDKIGRLKEDLSRLKIPKQSINLNWIVLVISLVCFSGMVWIGRTKVFDYNIVKASAEQSVFKALSEDYYTFKKSDYRETKKGIHYEITPISSK